MEVIVSILVWINFNFAIYSFPIYMFIPNYLSDFSDTLSGSTVGSTNYLA